MPPLPGLYNSTFTAGGPAAGFDVQKHGYGSTVEGNSTVRPIPWSQTYSVVIQRGGLKPHKRHYKALVYTEADFIALALLVNKPNGVLVTPREPSGVAANLDMLTRGATEDFTTPIGLTEVDLTFTLLA